MAWPELVGKSGEEAKKFLEGLNQGYQVSILPEGSPCTRDFRPDRVRVFVDGNGVVVHPPNAC